jgi:hypothetical protein
VSGGTSTTFSTTSSSISVTSSPANTIDVKAQGPKGDKGDTGAQGPAGIGPAGGTENQFVQKNSATDYDTKWSSYTLPAADGTERQVLSTDGAGTLSFGKAIAEHVHLLIRNDEGATINAGTPIYSRGEIGGSDRIRVGIADASDPAKMPAIGIAETTLNTTDAKDGHGIITGAFNINVSGFTGLSEGDILYVSNSGGGLSQTKPTGTQLIQNVGIVLKTNGTTLQGLQVSCIGRTNDVPNIPNGQAWIGNASGVATPTTLAAVATSGAYSDLSGTPSIPVSGVDFDPVGTDNSTDVTLAGAYDYITIVGQTITRGQVDYTTDISNTPTIPSALSDLTGTSDNITEGTTNKFLTTAEETKLGFISVTQAVDLDTMESDIATNNAKVSNVTTDLTTTHAASTVTVNSSDGTDATINGATTSLAGVMTGADKTKLDGIETSADVTDATNVTSSLVAATAISAGDKTTIQTNIGVDPAGTDNSTDVTANANITDVVGMGVGQVLRATDAGADKLVFWDDSDSKLTYATIGTNLTMTGTTLSASGGGAANMSQSFSAPTSVGEFQSGARLVTGAYGGSPAATAGTLVYFGNTNVAAAGAQLTAAAATGMLTVVTDAADADELLVEGVVKMSTNSGWSTAKKGAALYMSTTAGQVTTTAPSTAGDFVRVVGHVVDATNSTIYFKPDNTWLEL